MEATLGDCGAGRGQRGVAPEVTVVEYTYFTMYLLLFSCLPMSSTFGTCPATGYVKALVCWSVKHHFQPVQPP